MDNFTSGTSLIPDDTRLQTSYLEDDNTLSDEQAVILLAESKEYYTKLVYNLTELYNNYKKKKELHDIITDITQSKYLLNL